MDNFTQHITRTRIAIPRKRADLISRQRLLDALDELLDKKVIIIAAPAGYGKTSLLIDLADDLALPVCWYSLDALDQNISRFLEYFVASIQVKFPDFTTSMINILHSSFQKEVDVDAMVTMLVNDIYDQITEHFIIMLDDYHLVVEDTQINQFLSRFLQNVEENCHIVFASRTLLALPDLPLMVARGLVGGLGFEELAFTTGETRELFFTNHHIVLSDTEAENLCKQTEGWITGLLLTAQTSISRLQAHEKSLRATGVNINDYFELIYDAQPEQIQQFLLYTSLLEDFDFDTFNHTVGKRFPELCKQYKACADHIFKANLFVQSVGLDGLSLRYHHLFLDYLQQKVRLEEVETYENLQNIIANYYRQTQQWEKAYEIYRKEGHLEKQIELLEEAGLSMMSSGNSGVLHNWFNDFTEDEILKYPALCSLKGILLSTMGDLTNSYSYLSAALAILDANKNPELTGRTLVRMATILRMLGEYSKSLTFSQKALDLAKDEISLRRIRAESKRIIGSCYIEMGEPINSLEYLTSALDDFKYIDTKDEIATTSLNLSTVYVMLNKLDEAKKQLVNVIDYWEKTSNNLWLANALNNLGFLQHISGDVENAIMNLEKGLHYSRLTKYSRIEAITLCSIADIYSDLGAIDEALSIYKEALEIAKEIETKYIQVHALFSLSINYIFIKDLVSAKSYLDEARNITNESDSEYDKNLVNFAEALLYFYDEQYEISFNKFLQTTMYFEQNKHITFIGRDALYTFLSSYILENEGSLVDSYKILQEQIHDNNNQFTLLPSCLRELSLIQTISKEKKTFTDLENLISQTNKFKEKLPQYRTRIRRKLTLIPFAPAKLEIIGLGDQKVKYNDTWLSTSDWQTQSARDLFFLILSSAEGITKEEIGILLWPEDSEQELKFHFKNAIYRIRHAIGKDSVVLVGDKYLFNRNLDYYFDVEQFYREIKSISDIKNWHEIIKHYKVVLSIYQGKYIPGINTSWIIHERESIHKTYMQFLSEMANKAFQHEEFSLTVEIAHEILKHDPCKEDAYRIAMRAQAARGNRNDIDQLFKQCVKCLSEELEAPPSNKTKKLYQTLMRI